MQIIEASLNNLELLVPLFDSYRMFYHQPSDEYRAKEFLKNRIQNKESRIFIALEEIEGEEEAVGFIQLYPSFSSVSMENLWILNDLFVMEEHRKKSIATGLIDKAKQMAKETGSKGLILETAVANSNAQKLYEKLGFVKSEGYFAYNYTFQSEY